MNDIVESLHREIDKKEAENAALLSSNAQLREISKSELSTRHMLEENNAALLTKVEGLKKQMEYRQMADNKTIHELEHRAEKAEKAESEYQRGLAEGSKVQSESDQSIIKAMGRFWSKRIQIEREAKEKAEGELEQVWKDGYDYCNHGKLGKIYGWIEYQKQRALSPVPVPHPDKYKCPHCNGEGFIGYAAETEHLNPCFENGEIECEKCDGSGLSPAPAHFVNEHGALEWTDGKPLNEEEES